MVGAAAGRPEGSLVRDDARNLRVGEPMQPDRGMLTRRAARVDRAMAKSGTIATSEKGGIAV